MLSAAVFVRSGLYRFLGPGSHKSYRRDNCIGCRHFSLEPLRKRVKVAQSLDGNIELLDLRPQTAKDIVAPSREVRITPKQHLQMHVWGRQSSLLEDSVKSGSHLRVRS